MSMPEAVFPHVNGEVDSLSLSSTDAGFPAPAAICGIRVVLHPLPAAIDDGT
jgi:hypothetical protein